MASFPELSKEEIISLRKKHLSPSLSTSYSSDAGTNGGLHIVRGKDQYLYDEKGNEYLDCRNNVQHIGHCNDQITKCVTEQISKLMVNTRYLHSNIVLYARELTSLCPNPLNCAQFVNSGSESNEYALRLSTSFHCPKRKHILSFEHGYHGNTNKLIDISHYKLIDQPNPSLLNEVPATTHFVPIPDKYRGKHTKSPTKHADLSEKDICDFYINDLAQMIDDIDPNRNQISTFMIETVVGCGGQIFLPDLYLFKVRKLFIGKYGPNPNNQPIMIVDEVQCGFGRLGYPYYWAFQHNSQSENLFVPDILSLGKSIGNGFPLSAVVTNENVLNAFKKNNNNQEYFNTFGGNPVACLVGLNVLQILKEKNYLIHAQMIGHYFIQKLKDLQREINNEKSYVFIGDIRGKGLFIGIEFVKDLKTKEPATHETEYIVNKLVQKPYLLLLSIDGPFENVLKVKPPLCFNQSNADRVVASLKEVIQQTSVQSKL